MRRSSTVLQYHLRKNKLFRNKLCKMREPDWHQHQQVIRNWTLIYSSGTTIQMTSHWLSQTETLMLSQVIWHHFHPQALPLLCVGLPEQLVHEAGIQLQWETRCAQTVWTCMHRKCVVRVEAIIRWWVRSTRTSISLRKISNLTLIRRK